MLMRNIFILTDLGAFVLYGYYGSMQFSSIRLANAKTDCIPKKILHFASYFLEEVSHSTMSVYHLALI